MTEVNHALSDVLEAFDDGAIQCNTQQVQIETCVTP